eukprot:g43430.t1
MISKFADDTKICSIVDSEEGYQKLQQDLDQMGKWAEKWQMEFNIDKYEVLHFGKSNQGRSFMVNSRALRSVVEQKDFGVQVHSSLKVESQVDRAVKMAFGTLAFNSQGMKYRIWEVMLQLYRTLRVVCKWNELLAEVVDMGTLTFKRHLDKYMDRRCHRHKSGLTVLQHLSAPQPVELQGSLVPDSCIHEVIGVNKRQGSIYQHWHLYITISEGLHSELEK